MAGCTGIPEIDKMWLSLEITYILINHCLVSVLVLMLPCLIWLLCSFDFLYHVHKVFFVMPNYFQCNAYSKSYDLLAGNSTPFC